MYRFDDMVNSSDWFYIYIFFLLFIHIYTCIPIYILKEILYMYFVKLENTTLSYESISSYSFSKKKVNLMGHSLIELWTEY